MRARARVDRRTDDHLSVGVGRAAVPPAADRPPPVTSTLPAPRVAPIGLLVRPVRPPVARIDPPPAGPAPEQPQESPLTRARTAAGLTIAGLARRVHVSRPTVSLWERGNRRADDCYWPLLGAALGLDEAGVAALFAGSPQPPRTRRPLPSLGWARRRSGLTQREVAGALGVATTTLSMWETAGVPVPTRTAEQLADLLGTDAVRLTGPPPAAASPDPRPLRRFRIEAGMAQREAAATLRIAVGTLARYEAGERVTPVAVVRRMAAAYQRPVAEVLAVSGVELVRLPPLPWAPADVPMAIAALRVAAGLTKEQLARAVGRSGQTVSSWETGRRRPGPETCRSLETVFGLPPGRFPA
jgi:transcriptional regulator with XRE-family HTH domain